MVAALDFVMLFDKAMKLTSPTPARDAAGREDAGGDGGRAGGGARQLRPPADGAGTTIVAAAR